MTSSTEDIERARGDGGVVLLLIAMLAAPVALLYAPSFVAMAAVWQSSDYRHGIVVFPAAAFLLWRARKPLGAAALRPFAWGILALVPLILTWTVSRAVGVQTVEQLTAVLLIPATVLTFLGWPLFRRASFPLLFLIAAVPIGDALVPYLMDFTADLSMGLLQLVGVPVHRVGQFLSLPGGDFAVAEVCSGLAYLTAGTIIALLFVHLFYQSTVKRVAFVLAMAVVMVVANGVRAFTVMWVGSASDMRYLARDHVAFGWLLFAVVIAATIYIGSRFADAGGAATGEPTRVADTSGLDVSAYRPFGRVVALAAAAILLCAGPLLSGARFASGGDATLAMESPIVEGCDAPGPWSASWQPEFQSPDAVLAATYSCGGEPVHAFVAVYLDNLQGREVVGNANKLLPEDWRRSPVADKHDFIGAGRTIHVNEVRLTAPTREGLAWYWYDVGGRTTTAPAMVKLLQALRLVTGGRADGSVYLLSTGLDDSAEAGRRRLASVGAQVVALAAATKERSDP